jgi:hypothetical protein
VTTKEKLERLFKKKNEVLRENESWRMKLSKEAVSVWDEEDKQRWWFERTLPEGCSPFPAKALLTASNLVNPVENWNNQALTTHFRNAFCHGGWTIDSKRNRLILWDDYHVEKGSEKVVAVDMKKLFQEVQRAYDVLFKAFREFFDSLPEEMARAFHDGKHGPSEGASIDGFPSRHPFVEYVDPNSERQEAQHVAAAHTSSAELTTLFSPNEDF